MARANGKQAGGMLIRMGGILLDHPEVIEKLQKIIKKKIESARWGGGSVNIQLADLDDAALEELTRTLESVAHLDSKIRGALKDIETWKFTKNDAHKAARLKPRTLSSLADMLTNYILSSPNRHLYKRRDEISLVSLVTGVTYDEGSTDSKPYVCLKMCNYYLGALSAHSVTWHSEDIRGKTIAEILRAEGYVLENPALRADYDFDCDLYVDYSKTVGRQFWATGEANVLTARYDYEEPYSLGEDGEATRVVVDTKKKKKSDEDRAEKIGDLRYALERDLDEDEEMQEIPLFPYIECFDLSKHRRVSVHVRDLEPYQYDKDMAAKLIIPDDERRDH